jgi:hypothetical protein
MPVVKRIFIVFASPAPPEQLTPTDYRLRVMELNSYPEVLNEDSGFVIEEHDDAIYVMTEKAAAILAGLLETGLSPERINVLESSDWLLASENEVLETVGFFEQPDNLFVIYEAGDLDISSNNYLEISNQDSGEGIVMFDEESANDGRLSI